MSVLKEKLSKVDLILAKKELSELEQKIESLIVDFELKHKVLVGRADRPMGLCMEINTLSDEAIEYIAESLK